MTANDRSEVFVAPTGDDTADGSLSRPFATPWRATDWLAESRGRGFSGDLTVTLAAAVFCLDRPIALGAAHTSASGRTVIRAQAAGRSVLSGAVSVPAALLSGGAGEDPVEREAVQRAGRPCLAVALPSNAASTLDLGTIGHGIEMPLPPVRAFSSGVAVDWARWPAEPGLDGRVTALTGAGPPTASGRTGLVVEIDPAALAGLDQDPGVWIELVVRDDWCWVQARVTEIDRAQGLVATSLPPHVGAPGDRVTAIRFINALKGLGEAPAAILDGARRRILIAQEHCATAEQQIEVTVNESALFHLVDAQRVEIFGLVLRSGSGSGIVAEACEDVAVTSCDLHGFGRSGISLEGPSMRVEHCAISNTGTASIRLASGDSDTLEPGHSAIRSCRLRRWGEWKRVYEPGIFLLGVGTRVEACDLREGPHNALNLIGNDHHIEGCLFADVVRRFDDMGAIYVAQGERPLCRGLFIVGNAFLRVGDGRTMTHAVYLDRASTGVTVERNLFYRIGTSGRNSCAIFANGPSDTRIVDNLFVDCARPVEIDFYLSTWGRAKDLSQMQAAWARSAATLAVPGCVHLQRYPALAAFATADHIRPTSNSISGNFVFDPDGRCARAGPIAIRSAEPDIIETDRNNVFAEPPVTASQPVLALIAGMNRTEALASLENLLDRWATEALGVGLAD